MLKTGALLCQSVQVGRLDGGMPSAAEAVSPLLVGGDEDQVGPFPGWIEVSRHPRLLSRNNPQVFPAGLKSKEKVKP